MDGYSVLCLLLAGGGVLFGLIQWLRARRQLAQMDRMLDRALEGQFQETTFDESAPSALEAKLARFLNGSAASARGLAEERGKIAALIADISHQTKTPIAALLLYSSLLAESPLPPEQREQARAVQAQAEKLRFLIETLVKSSRLDSGILVLTPALHPVAPLLEEAAAQYAGAAAEKNISLTVQPAQGSARFDQKWTAEALGNVVDNAVKYTPPGGAVTLSAVFYELFCCIQVSDTGPGVPEGEQARIFGRFYRGEEVRDQEGLGLGLFLTRSILTREGGYVKLSSKSGKGSTFSLYLPLFVKKPAQNKIRLRQGGGARGGGSPPRVGSNAPETLLCKVSGKRSADFCAAVRCKSNGIFAGCRKSPGTFPTACGAATVGVFRKCRGVTAAGRGRPPGPSWPPRRTGPAGRSGWGTPSGR